ncbi:hypothetical protein [Aquimarina macrocephali]|uniref:hypothetical protein n=1 Tax=Aquimarina macrocephali TaxID=666563 RepID=UPI0004675536|nr:hypothetical protein [Aquimarina macrocephali]
MHDKKLLNEETGRYLKGRNFDNHSFGMMRRLIESYVDNQRFQMNSSELQSSNPTQINPPGQEFAMRWYANGSFSSFHPFWGVGNVMSQLYDNSPDSWAREGYSIRQMFEANGVAVPSSVYDAQLGQIFDFHSDGWGLKPVTRSEVLIYFTGNVGQQLGYDRFTFPSFLQNSLAVEAALAYSNGQTFDYNLRRTVESLANKLTLNELQKKWLIENKEETYKIDDHISYNNQSAQSIDDSKLYVIVGHSATPWRGATGAINNNSFFSYNAVRDHTYADGQMVREFRLDNGDYLAIGDYANCAYCSSSSQRTLYRPRNEVAWFDVVIPSSISSDAHPFDFIINGFWDGAKLTGRYIIPLEDVIIMLGGRDFNGEQANQYLAGGMLIVGFIPGGKLLRPIARITKGTLAWKLVVKVGNQSVSLTYKVVGGVVTFGSRSKLAQIIVKAAGEEAHHMIPWALRGDDVVQEAAYAGFHMNAKVNGRALKKFSSLTPDGIHGNHPAYNEVTQFLLDKFKQGVPNFSPEQAADFLEGNLIPRLDNWIEAAKGSGLNLNEYFKQIVKPELGI